jgi:hypothetical protein
MLITINLNNDIILVRYFIGDTEDTRETQEIEQQDNEAIRALLLRYFESPENYFEYHVYTTDLLSLIMPLRTRKNVLSVEQVDNLEKLELYTSCPICMEDNSDNIKLNCQHIFCKDCIKTWLSEQSNTCPICRIIVQ